MPFSLTDRLCAFNRPRHGRGGLRYNVPMKEPGPILIVVAAVVVRDGRVLLTRRSAGTHLEGYWELPGGKVEPGESPPAALERELAEELGTGATIGAPFAFNYHEYPAPRVLLLAYAASLHDDPRPIGCAELAWFDGPGVRSLRTPDADVPIFAQLLPRLGRDAP